MTPESHLPAEAQTLKSGRHKKNVRQAPPTQSLQQPLIGK